MSATIDRVRARLATAWQGVDVPKLDIEGERAKLIYRQGQSVTFDLHNRDLALSEEDFALAVLNPAIAALKAKLDR